MRWLLLIMAIGLLTACADGTTEGERAPVVDRQEAPPNVDRQPQRVTTSGGDRDCGDFGSHAEAQRFFEAAGPGDPHRLDRDRDGLACELN